MIFRKAPSGASPKGRFVIIQIEVVFQVNFVTDPQNGVVYLSLRVYFGKKNTCRNGELLIALIDPVMAPVAASR